MNGPLRRAVLALAADLLGIFDRAYDHEHASRTWPPQRSSTRLSTADERGSILTQLADCRAAAEAEDREVIAEHHDEAASAFKGNRGAGLTRAKDAAIKAGAELWVQHSDRLARGDGITADHLAEVWFALRRHGAGSGRCKMTGESECGARGAVSSPVPMDAGRTSALLLARTGSAVASSRAT